VADTKKKYLLKGNFEKYQTGETLDEIDVDRYLKCYPYMVEVVAETGEVTAPADDDIAAAKERIEQKRASGKGKLTAKDAKDAKTTK